MDKRFSHISEKFGSPAAFLEKLEKINGRMEEASNAIVQFNKNSISGRMQTALGINPFQRIDRCMNEWQNTTGYLYPIICDKDGQPAYLSSFLDEHKLRSSINTDFYHLPESQINPTYTYYEAACTLDHTWLVKRDAEQDMTRVIPEHGELWTHFSHSGAQQIAEHGIMINTYEDNGKVNLERNLTHYGDMGHVMTALNAGIEYKNATHVFLCDIPDADHAKLDISKDAKGNITTCLLAPEHICAVMTIENAKIVDVCTREEFLERFKEADLSDAVGDIDRDTGYEPELGLNIESHNQQENSMEQAKDDNDLER